MSSPKERLTHLLELAGKGPAARPQLAHELADLLIDWPADYPAAARLPFEALLEKAVRETGHETRAAIAERFAVRPDAPVDLLNELFFAAPPAMKDEIVARNDREGVPAQPLAIDEARLIAAARDAKSNLPRLFAHVLGLSESTAREILDDSAAQSLALACRAVHMSRAGFSALAVMSDRMRAAEDSYLRLAVYDTVPQAAAERMLAFWRARRAPARFSHAAE
jgi:hypothetical protein